MFKKENILYLAHHMYLTDNDYYQNIVSDDEKESTIIRCDHGRRKNAEKMGYIAIGMR
uniref:Uncharacterized protein n=1 Tax=Arundo donax TaxID=35708 RepID=A0A0A9FXC0_ARUDO